MMENRRTAPLARDAMAYVLAGGRGSRLMELTDAPSQQFFSAANPASLILRFPMP
jgi:dTDP-glucose pyrophosphorylase